MDPTIASELSTIKWLLAAILVTSVIFIIVFGVFLWGVSAAIKDLMHQRKSNVFHLIAKGHLERDEIDDLIEYATEHLKTHPNNSEAHWYLARAYYQAEEWVKAKRYFQRSVDISPTYRESAEDYLFEIEGKLKDSKPQLVE